MIKVYSNGNVKTSLRNSFKNCWIDVVKPNKEELSKLKKLKISSGDFNDSLDSKELPRIEENKDYIFVVLKVPSKNNVATLGVFLGKTYILTVHKEGIKALNIVNKNLDKSSFKKGPNFIFYRIILEIIKEFSVNLDEVGDKLDKLEDRILKNSKDDDLKEAFSLKKHLLFFRKSIKADMDVVYSLNKIKRLAKDDGFKDLYLEIKQLENTQELYRERLTEVMDMYMNSVSNKLNDIMRGFTVIASLLLLPMLVSGIWGMNFAKIPWFDSPYGFYFPLVIMFVSVLLMFLFFKRKRWI